MRTEARTWARWLPSVLDCPASLPTWRQSALVLGTGRGSGSGHARSDSPRAASLLGADSAGSVPAKGICLTPVAHAVPSRSQRHALGPWAVTATTTWTLWVPSFCRAPRANCTFKVGCQWRWREQRGGGGSRLWEEGWESIRRPDVEGEGRRRWKAERNQWKLKIRKSRQLWCLFKNLNVYGTLNSWLLISFQR